MAPLLDSAIISEQSLNSVVAIPVAALISVVLAVVSVSICACCCKKNVQTRGSATDDKAPQSNEVTAPEAEKPPIMENPIETPPNVEKAKTAIEKSSIPHPDQAGSLKLTSHVEGSMHQVQGKGTGTSKMPSLRLIDQTERKPLGHAPPMLKESKSHGMGHAPSMPVEPKSHTVGHATPMEPKSHSVGQQQHHHQQPVIESTTPKPTPAPLRSASEVKDDTDNRAVGVNSKPPASSPRSVAPASMTATRTAGTTTATASRAVGTTTATASRAVGTTTAAASRTVGTTTASASRTVGTKLTSKSVAPSPLSTPSASPSPSVVKPRKTAGKTGRIAPIGVSPSRTVPATTRSVPPATSGPGGPHRGGPDDSELDETSKEEKGIEVR